MSRPMHEQTGAVRCIQCKRWFRSRGVLAVPQVYSTKLDHANYIEIFLFVLSGRGESRDRNESEQTGRTGVMSECVCLSVCLCLFESILLTISFNGINILSLLRSRIYYEFT